MAFGLSLVSAHSHSCHTRNEYLTVLVSTPAISNAVLSIVCACSANPVRHAVRRRIDPYDDHYMTDFELPRCSLLKHHHTRFQAFSSSKQEELQIQEQPVTDQPTDL